MWCMRCHYGSEVFKPVDLETYTETLRVEGDDGVWRDKKVKWFRGKCPRCGLVPMVAERPFPDKPRGMGSGKATEQTKRNKKRKKAEHGG